MEKLNLEVGKYYRNEDDNIVKIVDKIGDDEDGYQFYTKDDVAYSADGCNVTLDAGDLVAEVIVLPTPTMSSPVKKTTIGHEFTLVVHAVTDGVPGAYDDPTDLFREIVSHRYVKSVDLIE